MGAFEAINMAADHIEKYPERYNFLIGDTPTNCRMGCMLGRIGQMAGYRPGVPVGHIADRVLGCADQEFYQRIWNIMGCPMTVRSLHDAALVPAALRTYADLYHGKREGIPAQVREIFMTATQMQHLLARDPQSYEAYRLNQQETRYRQNVAEFARLVQAAACSYAAA